MTDSFDFMPQPTTNLEVIQHRVTELEAHAKVIYEVRDAVRELAVEVRLRPANPCPSPGKCLELEKQLDALRDQIRDAKAAARTAGWIAKSFAGLVAVAGTVVAIWKR